MINIAIGFAGKGWHRGECHFFCENVVRAVVAWRWGTVEKKWKIKSEKCKWEIRLESESGKVKVMKKVKGKKWK